MLLLYCLTNHLMPSGVGLPYLDGGSLIQRVVKVLCFTGYYDQKVTSSLKGSLVVWVDLKSNVILIILLLHSSYCLPLPLLLLLPTSYFTVLPER